MAEPIEYTVEDGVATIALARPPVNALSSEMFRRLGELAAKAGDDTDVKVAILTGRGRTFCAGADVHELATLGPEERERLFSITNETRERFLSIPVPVLAAINGAAAGAGVSYATFCDYRIASESATFRMPEIEVNSVAGGGATLRRVGVPSGALRMLLYSAEPIPAEDALRCHLVDEVVPPARLMDVSIERASTIAAKPRSTLIAMKKAIALSSEDAAREASILAETQAMTIDLVKQVSESAPEHDERK